MTLQREATGRVRGRGTPLRTVVVAITAIWALLGQSVVADAQTVPSINEDIISCSPIAGDPYLMPSNVCAAWGRMQEIAIDRVVEFLGLTADRTLVLTRARSTVRAMLWAMVNEAAAKRPVDRTADETLALTWLGSIVRQHSIEVAQRSLEMFDDFYRDERPGATSPPCTFTPPFPYQNEYPGKDKVRESFCFAGYFPDVFGIGVTNKPKAEEWLRWANADVMAGKFNATSGAITRDMAAQMGLLGAAVAAGAVAVTIPALVGAQLIATSSFMATTFSLGGVIVGGVATLAFAALGLFVAALGVAAAIYGSIVFFDNQRPALEKALAAAEKPFEIGALFATDKGAELTFSLFSGWLGTQPDPGQIAAVPARVGADPRFTVSPAGSTSTTVVDSFTIGAFGGSGGPARTVTMQGGFWVITDSSGTTVTLDLPGVDASGQDAIIRRVRQADGSFGFQAVRPDAITNCSTATPCPVSRQFTIVTPTGFQTVRYAGTQDGQDLPALTFDFDKVSTTTIGTAAPFFAAVFDAAGTRVSATYTWELGNRCLTRYSSGCPIDLTGAPKAPDGSLITTIGTTQSMLHSFPTSGTWWMRVKATTSAGTTASNWFTVEVSNPAPVLALTSSTGTVECSTDGTTTCPSTTVGPFGLVLHGNITDEALQHELETVTIDWGDGVVEWGDSGLDLTLCPGPAPDGGTVYSSCVLFGTRAGDSVPFSADHRPPPGVYGARSAKVTVRDSGGNQVSLTLPYFIPDTRQTQTAEIAPASPSSWATPIGVTASASSGLPVTLSAAPEQWCVIDNGQLYAARAGTCTVTGTQTGDATYQPATASQTFTFTPRQATISFPQPPDTELFDDPATTLPIVFSAADATGTARSGVVGAFSVSPDVCVVTGDQVSLLATGSCTVYAAIPTTETNWEAEPVEQTFNVLRRTQTLTLFTPTLAGVTAGSAPVQASSTSGLPVTLTASPSTVCSIVPFGAQWTVTFVGAGECAVTAQQVGDATWSPATVTNTISITKDNQSSFIVDAPAEIAAGGAFSVRVGGSIGTPIVVAAGPPTVCGVNLTQSTINPGGISTYLIETVGGGNCLVTADRAADIAYNAAPQASVAVQVNAGTQTITFAPIADALVRGPAFVPVVSASSGLPVTLTSATPAVCSVAPDGSVLPAGPGRCTLTATQAGDGRYSAAEPQSRTFLVGYRVDIVSPVANSIVRRNRASAVLVVIRDGRGRLVDPDATRIGRCSPAVSVTFGAVRAGCVTRTITGTYVAAVDTRTVPIGAATISARVTLGGIELGAATVTVTVAAR